MAGGCGYHMAMPGDGGGLQDIIDNLYKRGRDENQCVEVWAGETGI